VYVDSIYDIGRIENVHFNPWWSMKPALFSWQQAHGRPLSSAAATGNMCSTRSVSATTSATSSSKPNRAPATATSSGFGADDCFTALLVENSARMGLLISNGEFVSFHGPDPTMVRVEESNSGSVRFVNCAFWGPCNQIGKARRQRHGGVQRLHLHAVG